MKKKVDHNPDLDRLTDWVSKYKLGAKGPTLKQLVDSGFCRIKDTPDVKNCIARLDKKDWMDYVKVEFPGSHDWELNKCADLFRTRLAKGFRNVPKNLYDLLPWSHAVDSPTEFRYHWSFKGVKVPVEPAPTKKVKKAKAPAPAAPAEPAFDEMVTSGGEHLNISHEAMMEAMAEFPELPVAPAPAAEPAPAPDEVTEGEWEEVKKTAAEAAPKPLPPLEPVAEMAYGEANGAYAPMNGLESTAMKVVVVTFAGTGSQEYFYFAPVDTRIGDYAVVHRKASEDTSNPFSIGLIERDDPDLQGMARSAILGVFNETFATGVQSRMDQIVQVKARLIQKRRQYDERQIYELLAQQDGEARELLDMLKHLESTL